MIRERQCLNCQNYQPKPHAGWAAPEYDRFAEYTLWNLREHLGDNVTWNSGWPGQCRLQPTPTDVQSIHRCGQWAVNALFLQTWRDIYAAHRARTNVRRLEAELKAAKALSLERYHRLKQANAQNAARQKAAP